MSRSYRAAPVFRCLAVVAAALTATGCWNLPDFSFLDDPAFRSFAVGADVWAEAHSFNALPVGSRMELDPALLGSWNELGERTAAWTFEAAAGGDYALRIESGGFPALFEGTLHRIGPDAFLDLSTIAFTEAEASPAEAGQENTAEAPSRVHAFFKLNIDGNVARLEGINAAKTRELITSGQLELANDPSFAPGLRITAPGEEIEAFLRRFADDPELIGLENGFELRR